MFILVARMKLLEGNRKKFKATERHWILRYGLAVALVAITIGIAVLLNNFGVKLNFTIPVVLALVAGAWYGGRGPGLLIGVLFQATTITYAKVPEDTVWAALIFGYFSTFCLYVFLALLISGLRNLLRRLSEQRDLLHVTLASIGDAVIATNPSGRVTFMNPVAEQLTGWNETQARGQDLENVFRTVDEYSHKVLINPVDRVLATGAIANLSNQTRLISKTGKEIPIENSAAPITYDDEIKGVVLVFSDVSERRAAERSLRERETMRRIVEAQEAERYRIARDLHDHLGQKMTALRLRIENVADDLPHSGSINGAIEEVKRSAANIDRDIGFLSWELKPTELKDLGLVDALRSFVREWSNQYGISAEFQTSQLDNDTVERLDISTETNLYRIVQEALSNVLKHARANCVNVLLHRREGHLILIIEDDGRGFDHEPASATPALHGLGLIGMVERAALLKGTFEIDTHPGGGTTIIVSIPMQNEGRLDPS